MSRKLFSIDDLLESDGAIQLGYGSGGQLTAALIEFLIRDVKYGKVEDGIGLEALDDGASIPVSADENQVVVSSDGHTVDPLFFPGGDLGKLSACGTINDILMMGAHPIAITHVLIIEEGFLISDLKRLNDSFVSVINRAKVALIAGDTKVMPRGSIQGCISATTGIGVARRVDLVQDNGVQPGDDIVVTGSLGDHGIALLAYRHGMEFETGLVSDVAVLGRVCSMVREFGPHAMKDPTRGGLSMALNEFATKSNVSIWLDEDAIPFKESVISACEMLGLSQYDIPSEGKAIIAVKNGFGEDLVQQLKKLPEAKDAAVIGKAREEKPGRVFIKTKIGGTRMLSPPVGELIPRVC
ncbi:MAG: hydrogenase expression/formation protein HypE [Promethearchaeota archaeon]